MYPGDEQSAGKRRSGKTRSGSPWLGQALVEAAQAAGPTTPGLAWASDACVVGLPVGFERQAVGYSSGVRSSGGTAGVASSKLGEQVRELRREGERLVGDCLLNGLCVDGAGRAATRRLRPSRTLALVDWLSRK